MIVFQDPKWMELPLKQGPKIRTTGCESIGHPFVNNSKDWHQHMMSNYCPKPSYASNLKNLFDEYGHLKPSQKNG